MNELINKYKPILNDWHSSGRNYSLSVDWVELNQLAVQLGNQPFNLGCGDCRINLASYVYDAIKEGNI